MNPLLSDVTAHVQKTGRLDASDALAVRMVVFGETAVTPEEAEALIALNEAALSSAPDWKALFVEALTDFVVRQQTPSGYVDDAKAAWLMDRVARDGRIRSATELALLVHILDRADAAPAALSAFTLAQVKAHVLRPERPEAGEEGAARITREDVEQLRIVLFALAGEGRLAIGRAEAETLFDINDTVRGGANDPSWADFFARAVGAAVMAAPGYAPPTAAERIGLDAPYEEGRILRGVLGELAANVAGGRGFAGDTPTYAAEWERRNAADDDARARSEPVDEGEVDWLLARIGRDGEFDAAENALIRFLREESPTIHPKLAPLLERAA